MVTIQELRKQTNLSQKEFASKYNIPLSTLRKWEQGINKCPAQKIELLAYKIEAEKGLPSEDKWSIDVFELAFVKYQLREGEHGTEDEIKYGYDFFKWCASHKDSLNSIQEELLLSRGLRRVEEEKA